MSYLFPNPGFAPPGAPARAGKAARLLLHHVAEPRRMAVPDPAVDHIELHARPVAADARAPPGRPRGHLNVVEDVLAAHNSVPLCIVGEFDPARVAKRVNAHRCRPAGRAGRSGAPTAAS